MTPNRDDIIRMAAEVWTTGSFYPIPSSDDIERFFQAAYSAGAADEREACAKVCETEWSNVAERIYGEECAAAIRARRNT